MTSNLVGPQSIPATDVHWLEQTEADVPTDNRWLSASETSSLLSMRFAKRRNDWRLGRWTAKRVLAARLNLPGDLSSLANTEVLAGPSGAPEVLLCGKTAPVTISLSHRASTAMCTVAGSGIRFGCDLERIEPRSDAFTADYFTVNEQTLIERAGAEERPLLVTLLWSAKESALKAMHMGLRLDTIRLEVEFVEQSRQDLPYIPKSAANPAWRPLYVRSSDGQSFRGLWRHQDQMVRTVVSDIPFALTEEKLTRLSA